MSVGLWPLEGSTVNDAHALVGTMNSNSFYMEPTYLLTARM